MGLPRTFVGFSSTDILYYRTMMGWAAHEHVPFNFYDLQLDREIRSSNEDYIKSLCRAKIERAGHYIMLIGADTRSKEKYVHWEAQVAQEKGCQMIGANLNGWRTMDENRTPDVMRDVGAIFIPFSARVIQHVLEAKVPKGSPHYVMPDQWYLANGYELIGPIARRTAQPKPWERL